jgi:hypothetical protein
MHDSDVWKSARSSSVPTFKSVFQMRIHCLHSLKVKLYPKIGYIYNFKIPLLLLFCGFLLTEANQ